MTADDQRAIDAIFETGRVRADLHARLLSEPTLLGYALDRVPAGATLLYHQARQQFVFTPPAASRRTFNHTHPRPAPRREPVAEGVRSMEPGRFTPEELGGFTPEGLAQAARLSEDELATIVTEALIEALDEHYSPEPRHGSGCEGDDRG